MIQPVKSRFELSVELARATAWPILALIVLLAFWTPLHDTARQVPELLGRSDTITIAGLSLELSRELRYKASPDVKEALGKLSQEAIKRLLNMGDSSWWNVGDESHGRFENGELLSLGLVEELDAADMRRQHEADQRKFGYGVAMTTLGRRTKSFLHSVVAEFVHELGRTTTE